MQTASLTTDLFKACGLLFGSEIKTNLSRLADLDYREIRDAFRRRALETHPDRAITLGMDPSVLNERFKSITLAYSELNAFIKNGKSISDIRVHRTRPGERGNSLYIPKRKLLIGQFLYYNKLISWDTYIKAIVWQRRRRPLIGRIAVQAGLLHAGTVHTLLSLRRKGERLGECTVRFGKLKPRDVKHLIRQQAILQPRIGSYFISNGYLSSRELDRMIQKLRYHNLKV